MSLPKRPQARRAQLRAATAGQMASKLVAGTELTGDAIRSITVITKRAFLEERPRTPAQLHAAIRALFGITVPYTTVFPDQNPPFEFIASWYFQTHSNIIGFGPRGGGKTAIFSIGHMVNSQWFPGYWGVHCASVTAQAAPMFEYINQHQTSNPAFMGTAPEHQITTKNVRWSNGSRLKLATGTRKGVSSQHPSDLTLDEIDFMHYVDFTHSLPVPVTRQGRQNMHVSASTRQFSAGTMNRLLEEKGAEPNWKIIKWTGFETMQPCRTCIALDQHPHGTDAARMSACPLWRDCRGRCRADQPTAPTGFISRKTMVDLFQSMRGNIEDWDAQIMGRKPSRTSLVFPHFEHKLYPEGNYTSWLYDPARPYWIFHDPAEARTAVFLFAQIDDEGRLHIFDELIVPNCTDDGDGKRRLFGFILARGYGVPEGVIIDPARTDARATFLRGSMQGIYEQFSYNAVCPSRKEKDGGQLVMNGIRAVRQLITSGGTYRRLLVNPDLCPALIEAIRNYSHPINEKGDVFYHREPTKITGVSDIMDALRYGIVYLNQQQLFRMNSR